MNTILKSPLRTVSILNIAAVLMLLPACSTAHGLTSTDNRQQLSNLYHRDSIYLHDSTAVMYKKGNSNNALAHAPTTAGVQTGKAVPTHTPVGAKKRSSVPTLSE